MDKIHTPPQEIKPLEILDEIRIIFHSSLSLMTIC